MLGLDLSINSPGITIIDFKNSKIFSYYFPKLKKQQGLQYSTNVTINSKLYSYCILPLSNKPINKLDKFTKFQNITDNILQVCTTHNVKHVYMEGYAFDAKCSSATSIHELSGIVKYALYKNKIPWTLIAPTTLKKKFTGSGRSDKDCMYQVFCKEGFPNLKRIFDVEHCKKVPAPVQDIVDSFALVYIHI